jgi:hypothetical protein
MFCSPAVTIHGLDHARATLAPGRRVVLISAPGAALYAGCGWWRALVAAAAAEFPATPMADLLDCADAPGQAMAALRLGCRGLILDPACPAFAAVRAAAGAVPAPAIVLPHRPPSLDLAARGAGRRLLAWLSGDNPTPLR